VQKRAILCVAVALSIAAGCGMLLRAQEDVGGFAEAQQYLKAGDLRAARLALVNAVKANPKSGEAHIALAKVSLDLFDAPAAKSALERAATAGVPEAEIAHLTAHALWMQGELVAAEATLLESSILGSNRTYALRILARVQMDKGDLAAAQTSFDEALGIAPDDSLIWTDLARLRFVLADQKGAIEAADHALKLDASNVRAIEFRGHLMRSQYGVVAALPWFERGLQIRPADIPLLEEYGLTLGEAGRYRDMLTQARKIIALDRNNPKAYYMQAVLAARAGDHALAKRILPRAGSDFLELPAVMLLDGICEYELGNYNRAVDRFQQLLGQQPRNRRVRVLLAQAMYRAGDPLDTLDTIREIAARGDADSYSLMLTARAFEASGQTARAADPLNDSAMSAVRPSLPLAEPVSLIAAADAARREPDNARAVLPYVRLLMAAGDSETALNEAVRLQRANGGVAEAHLLVGDIELDRGNLPAALKAFQAAREIRFTEPVMLRLVDALSRSGNEAGASESLSAYLAYNPQSLTALRLAAYRALDARQWRTAIELLERVRARLGNNDSILLANLARAYSAAGQHKKSVSYATTAYRVSPASVMVTRVYADVLKRWGKRAKAAQELSSKVAAMSAQRQ
jgi:cellulose synthase operon protein C